jgi:Dolichyl-phosphate-mannose-protein mannosyltransferase
MQIKSCDHKLPGQVLSVIALLAFEISFVWLLFESIGATPVMVDEFAHIPAGVSYWDSGRFALYRENPPLVRCLISLAPWLSGARVDYAHALAGYRSEWRVGMDFARANESRYARYLWQARMVVVGLAVACGGLIYWWSRELFGPQAAAVSAAFWFADPNVLAHSGMASTDIGTAFFGLCAGFTFWLFLRKPDWLSVSVAGIALGMAQGSKFSMIVLYPALLLASLLARRQSRDGGYFSRLQTAPFWRQLIVVFAISLITLNALYAFEGTFDSLGSYSFRSRVLSGVHSKVGELAAPANRFRGSVLAVVPVPFPRDYILGFDSQIWDTSARHARLEGGHMTRGGHWYSPFLILVQKVPLGTLTFVCSGLVFMLLPAGRRAQGVASGTLILPAAGVLCLLCLNPGLNWLIRYLLPCLPFALVACGSLVSVSWSKPFWRIMVMAAVAWNCISVVRARPYYLSYANELFGGPQGAQKLLLGSNYDWGQDLFRLKAWAGRHPGYSPLIVSYYGMLMPEAVGLSRAPVPDCFLASDLDPVEEVEPSADFYWAISSNYLNGMAIASMQVGRRGIVAVIQSPLLKPENAIARVGYSIYIFHISATDKPGPGPSLSSRDLRKCLREARGSDILNAP